MWKFIAKVWHLLRDNMIWLADDGCIVRCWDDAWVPNVGPLTKHVPGHANINSDCQKEIEKDESRHLCAMESRMYYMFLETAKDIWNCEIIRDEKGKWILGYNLFLGKCSVFVAELWSILDGLLLL
ncbi:hypothetical protein Goshw_022411 [Gossypium schwendimanii]|uniref:Reverse transcriptase zinc-binding domain-containing protein n=1 Tax=Gossypium schwendimanii TaxID=34291 RepID=A0A7J9KNA6_GOSSC|nr:hypothetical protein [Gossypium schwendimanii]